MLQLSRNGLILQSLTSLDESQGSSNVKVSIQNDGTYTNYSTQLHYGYYVHGFSYTKGIARYENGVFILPREAFEQYGLLNLSVLLVSSDEELMTNQVQFIVQAAPRGDMIIDDIPSAQQQVLQLVQTTLDQYANTINLNKNEIAVLKSRMDSFTSLQQGSTTGDAELIDGRVGYDGKTYENIGGAIRGQVSQLSDEINECKVLTITSNNILSLKNLTKGKYINRTNGELEEVEGVNATDFIEIDSKKQYIFYDYEQFDTTLAIYDVSKNYITGFTKYSLFNNTELPQNAKYIRASIYDQVLNSIMLCDSSVEKPNEYVPYNLFLNHKKLDNAKALEKIENIVNINKINLKDSDYINLRDCLEKIKPSKTNRYEIYLEEGEYDFSTYFTDEERLNPQIIGITIPDYVKLIGKGDKEKVILCWKGTINSMISTINTKRMAELENLTINFAVGGKYTIHDDYAESCDDTDVAWFTNIVINANGDGRWNYGIGGGLRSGQKRGLKNVTFNCDNNNRNWISSYHNNIDLELPAYVILENCRFNHGAMYSMAFGSLNDGLKTPCYVISKGTKLKKYLLREENVSTHGSGNLFYITGYANKFEDNGYGIEVTDGEDYNNCVDFI